MERISIDHMSKELGYEEKGKKRDSNFNNHIQVNRSEGYLLVGNGLGK